MVWSDCIGTDGLPVPRCSVTLGRVKTSVSQLLNVTVAVLVAFTIGCKDKAKPVSVIMISVDTLRVDALGSYGNRAARTPNIDRLAKEGVLFENTLSQAPATGPSFSSILTSKYPAEHGVLHSTKALEEDQLTMAEIFQQSGYRTGAFVSCSILSSKYGFSQGFDEYNEKFTRNYSRDHVERDARHVTKAAISWLSSSKEKPFFLWVHYFDPHTPYQKHASRDLDNEVGKYAFIRGIEKERSEDRLARHLPMIKKLYADEVAYTDDHVGKLMGELRRLGVIDNTLVILNSDHGEELFDHNFFHGHYKSMHQSVLHVPLIFRFPRALPGGQRIDDVVENIDILPTVLSAVGIKHPKGLSGYDLLAPMKGAKKMPRRIAWAQREPYKRMPGGDAFAAWADRWKFISFSRAKNQLFNLEKDPSEHFNTIDTEPKRASVFEKELQTWRGRGNHMQAVDRTQLEAESLMVLKNLGYVQ